jgi:hypothetical protein
MRLALALALAGAPALSLACPVCARDGTPHLALLVGGLVAAPYVVTVLVVRAIRGGGR